MDDGYDSMLLYLRRDEDNDRYTPFTSTRAGTGHYYYPVSIRGKTYPLQISSYGTKTTVVGEECRLACQVPIKYDHTPLSYNG